MSTKPNKDCIQEFRFEDFFDNTMSIKQIKDCTQEFRIDDLFDNVCDKNNNSHRSSNDIPKNQQVFGHNKRIKP